MDSSEHSSDNVKIVKEKSTSQAESSIVAAVDALFKGFIEEKLKILENEIGCTSERNDSVSVPASKQAGNTKKIKSGHKHKKHKHKDKGKDKKVADTADKDSEICTDAAESSTLVKDMPDANKDTCDEVAGQTAISSDVANTKKSKKRSRSKSKKSHKHRKSKKSKKDPSDSVEFGNSDIAKDKSDSKEVSKSDFVVNNKIENVVAVDGSNAQPSDPSNKSSTGGKGKKHKKKHKKSKKKDLEGTNTNEKDKMLENAEKVSATDAVLNEGDAITAVHHSVEEKESESQKKHKKKKSKDKEKLKLESTGYVKGGAVNINKPKNVKSKSSGGKISKVPISKFSESFTITVRASTDDSAEATSRLVSKVSESSLSFHDDDEESIRHGLVEVELDSGTRKKKSRTKERDDVQNEKNASMSDSTRANSSKISTKRACSKDKSKSRSKLSESNTFEVEDEYMIPTKENVQRNCKHQNSDRHKSSVEKRRNISSSRSSPRRNRHSIEHSIDRYSNKEHRSDFQHDARGRNTNRDRYPTEHDQCSYRRNRDERQSENEYRFRDEEAASGEYRRESKISQEDYRDNKYIEKENWSRTSDDKYVEKDNRRRTSGDESWRSMSVESSYRKPRKDRDESGTDTESEDEAVLRNRIYSEQYYRGMERAFNSRDSRSPNNQKRSRSPVSRSRSRSFSCLEGYRGIKMTECEQYTQEPYYYNRGAYDARSFYPHDYRYRYAGQDRYFRGRSYGRPYRGGEYRGRGYRGGGYYIPSMTVDRGASRGMFHAPHPSSGFSQFMREWSKYVNYQYNPGAIDDANSEVDFGGYYNNAGNANSNNNYQTWENASIVETDIGDAASISRRGSSASSRSSRSSSSRSSRSGSWLSSSRSKSSDSRSSRSSDDSRSHSRSSSLSSDRSSVSDGGKRNKDVTNSDSNIESRKRKHSRDSKNKSDWHSISSGEKSEHNIDEEKEFLPMKMSRQYDDDDADDFISGRPDPYSADFTVAMSKKLPQRMVRAYKDGVAVSRIMKRVKDKVRALNSSKSKPIVLAVNKPAIDMKTPVVHDDTEQPEDPGKCKNWDNAYSAVSTECAKEISGNPEEQSTSLDSALQCSASTSSEAYGAFLGENGENISTKSIDASLGENTEGYAAREESQVTNESGSETGACAIERHREDLSVKTLHSYVSNETDTHEQVNRSLLEELSTVDIAEISGQSAPDNTGDYNAKLSKTECYPLPESVEQSDLVEFKQGWVNICDSVNNEHLYDSNDENLNLKTTNELYSCDELTVSNEFTSGQAFSVGDLDQTSRDIFKHALDVPQSTDIHVPAQSKVFNESTLNEQTLNICNDASFDYKEDTSINESVLFAKNCDNSATFSNTEKSSFANIEVSNQFGNFGASSSTPLSDKSGFATSAASVESQTELPTAEDSRSLEVDNSVCIRDNSFYIDSVLQADTADVAKLSKNNCSDRVIALESATSVQSFASLADSNLISILSSDQSIQPSESFSECNASEIDSADNCESNKITTETAIESEFEYVSNLSRKIESDSENDSSLSRKNTSSNPFYSGVDESELAALFGSDNESGEASSDDETGPSLYSSTEPVIDATSDQNEDYVEVQQGDLRVEAEKQESPGPTEAMEEFPKKQDSNLMRPPTLIPPRRPAHQRLGLMGLKISATSAAIISSGEIIDNKGTEEGELSESSDDSDEGASAVSKPSDSQKPWSHLSESEGELKETDEGKKDKITSKKKTSPKKSKKSTKESKKKISHRKHRRSKLVPEPITDDEDGDRRARSRSRSFSVLRKFDEKTGVWREKKVPGHRRRLGVVQLGEEQKARLRSIAMKQAYLNMQTGRGLNVKLRASEKALVSGASGKRTVGELTDLCHQIAEASKYDDSETDDEETRARLIAMRNNDEDDNGFSSSVLKSREPSIIMNIRNQKQLPALTAQEKARKAALLRLQFPVSSGAQHHNKEWVPVEKSTNNNAATKADTQIVPLGPSRAPDVEPADLRCPIATAADTAQAIAANSVPTAAAFPDIDFSSTPLDANQSVDIGQIVSQRLSAMRRLQNNPEDMGAMESIHHAHVQMQRWAEACQAPGDFFYSVNKMGLMGDKLKKHDWLKKVNEEQQQSADQAQANQSAGAVPAGFVPTTDSQNQTQQDPAAQQQQQQPQIHQQQLQQQRHQQMLRYDIGKLLLQRMGWKEGLGLGKDNLGPVKPLEPTMKRDRKGLRTQADDPRFRLRQLALAVRPIFGGPPMRHPGPCFPSPNRPGLMRPNLLRPQYTQLRPARPGLLPTPGGEAVGSDRQGGNEAWQEGLEQVVDFNTQQGDQHNAGMFGDIDERWANASEAEMRFGEEVFGSQQQTGGGLEGALRALMQSGREVDGCQEMTPIPVIQSNRGGFMNGAIRALLQSGRGGGFQGGPRPLMRGLRGRGRGTFQGARMAGPSGPVSLLGSMRPTRPQGLLDIDFSRLNPNQSFARDFPENVECSEYQQGNFQGEFSERRPESGWSTQGGVPGPRPGLRGLGIGLLRLPPEPGELLELNENLIDMLGYTRKHPCSILVEVCYKRRWNQPIYEIVEESGPAHMKYFRFKVIVNGVEYIPIHGCGNKKQAKLEAAAVCLQELGVELV